MSITIQHLAWVAGILDMKGAVVRKRNKMRAEGSYQWVLQVESKQHEVVRGLSRLTGTAPEVQAAKEKPEWMRRGCSQHCPEAHVHVDGAPSKWGMPVICRWTVTGAAAAVILHNVMPFMTTDRGLTEMLGEIYTHTKLSGRGWGATRKSLRRLHELGWELPERFEHLDLGENADDSTDEAEEVAA